MSRLRRLLVGGERGIGDTVYGTVVALAALAAGASESEDALHLAVLVALTSLAIWVAHVYAHGLGESIERHRAVDGPELRAIAARELPILAAAATPVAGLLLGVIGLVRDSTAVWIAFGLGLLALALQGGRYSRVEGLRLPGTAAVVAVNVALGLLVVALKVFVLH